MPIMGLSSSLLVMPVANKRALCGARSKPFLILSLLNGALLVYAAAREKSRAVNTSPDK
jgi:hypothetical protein